MHTEEQARKLWCPMARGIMDSGGNRMAFGASGEEPENDDCAAQYEAEMADLYPCLASGCAMWRWETERNEALETIDWRGQCGLAGKAE